LTVDHTGFWNVTTVAPLWTTQVVGTHVHMAYNTLHLYAIPFQSGTTFPTLANLQGTTKHTWGLPETTFSYIRAALSAKSWKPFQSHLSTVATVTVLSTV